MSEITVTVPIKNTCDNGMTLKDEVYNWLQTNVGRQLRSAPICDWDFVCAEFDTGLATFRFLDAEKAILFKLFFS